jgi:hypothetical protein
MMRRAVLDCPVANDSPPRPARRRRVASRVPALLLVVVLATLSASALRHVLPDLKERTRATSAKTVERAPSTPAIRAALYVAPGSDVAAPVKIRAARLDFPRPANVARPNARPPGAEALGTGSLPRSRRWAVLGGHGRHGAG